MNRNSNTLFGLLTMCRRAGRMVMGFDQVKEASEKGNARLILLASDISAKTEKEVRFYADRYGTKVIKTEIPREELGARLGKSIGVLAVCDDGFADKAAELLTVH